MFKVHKVHKVEEVVCTNMHKVVCMREVQSVQTLKGGFHSVLVGFEVHLCNDTYKYAGLSVCCLIY